VVVADHFRDDVLCAEPPSDAPVESLPLAGLGLVGGEVEQRLPERPAASSRPRGVFDRYERLEELSAVTSEERPSNREVAGRIADGAAPEVEHAGQSPLVHEKVRAGHVAVRPDCRLSELLPSPRGSAPAGSGGRWEAFPASRPADVAGTPKSRRNWRCGGA
jgi:hypothetical protein